MSGRSTAFQVEAPITSTHTISAAPAEIHITAGMPARLEITNRDSTAEEFDSAALQIEKVIAGESRAPVRLRPLAPGRYPFMGEYHPDTAQGVIVAE